MNDADYTDQINLLATLAGLISSPLLRLDELARDIGTVEGIQAGDIGGDRFTQYKRRLVEAACTFAGEVRKIQAEVEAGR